MKDRIVAFRNHVKKHRGKYSALITALAFLKLMNRNGRVLEEFLREHNIDPNEYWTPEDSY